MKITDLYAVLNEIDIQIDETCPDLLDLNVPQGGLKDARPR